MNDIAAEIRYLSGLSDESGARSVAPEQVASGGLRGLI